MVVKMKYLSNKEIIFNQFWLFYSIVLIAVSVNGLELPDNCNSGQFYDTGSLTCRSCPVNASMVTSKDGFGCICEDHSVPADVARCRPCNATEVVSADGTVCVPRRCQNITGKFVCRKCPYDYIYVTQNLDGSPLKEVQCVKCARGYKPQNNACVKCESCTCAKNHLIISGVCVPRSFIKERPKYDKTELHPSTLLNIVKNEYLCTQNDYTRCRVLANQCVKNFYVSHPAGPCRLWLQQKIKAPEGLPQLNIQSTPNEKTPGEILIPRGKSTLTIATAVYTFNGGIMILKDVGVQISPCLPPVQLTIGEDIAMKCKIDLSKISSSEFNETLAAYIYMNGDFKQLPLTLRKPDGHKIERREWPSSTFSRYFMVHNTNSVTTNANYTYFMRTFIINIWIDRDKYNFGGLRVRLSAEAQYATKPSESSIVLTTFKVVHKMPNAGIYRGLEVWGGVLGALLPFYALVQWRGAIRRGSPYISLIPLFTSAVADTLYFSAWFSTLHIFAAETSTFGLALSPAIEEDYVIIILIYTAVFLKAVKVVWINFCQCKCDIFFLDWNEYNYPLQDPLVTKESNNWKIIMLAKEWSSLQTKRKVPPGYTVIGTLLIVQLLKSSISYLQEGKSYKWTVISIIWWSTYCSILLYRCLCDKLFGSPLASLSKICTGLNLSLIVFQEENYAHYVHGRNDDAKDVRSLSGPLSTCRIVCAPRLRSVYKKLSMDITGTLNEEESNRALLSRFLAAFFEKALDGLSWVASERTVLERLFDIEIVNRESGNTSTLLYDDIKIPSCFAVTWLGEEWTLATFDAMLFSSLLILTDDIMIAGLLTLLVWQTIKSTRTPLSIKNIKRKIHVEWT